MRAGTPTAGTAVALVAGAAFAASAGAATVAYKFVDKPIPDGNGARTVTFDIDLGTTPSVLDIDAMIRVTHPSTRQLAIRLKGPDGQAVSLSRRSTRGRNLGKGACKDPPQASTDFPAFTVFDDEGIPFSGGTAPYAGGFSPPYDPSFRPRRPLTKFDKTNGEGAWRMVVKDLRDGKAGTLECARLFIEH